ncbi:LacI family DNA-binding transcriptional regulator [Microlunatus flavus]|uniref:LacI family transcriptional regulator/LacI family transcriptional regulator, xylobiose transport system transcriptional regulator n=1 Tax=Microlunatus flavus TaxID=1036181 RepID=A0A1H9DUN4_9ACTN|nr:substrate-binding domain-containing protein [Microlunatus flavus]SEQ16533.1 LacI family transcriptional regulator/LacI family transcriptional regulator, xylobiose transport system transcriptional regulator [Microlunatus flavus]
MAAAGPHDPGDARVTVADIARDAGVSIATVSKVLNRRPDVAPETRARVNGLLAERGYVLSARTRNKTRASRPARGGLVDLVFNDPGSPWAAEVIRGAAAAARTVRASIVVTALDPEQRGRRRWLDDLADRGSLGLVLAVSSMSAEEQGAVRQLGLPVVLMDLVGDFESTLPALGTGNFGGGVAATQHLLDLGHRRVATITGPQRYLSSQARLAGYRAALERAGLPVAPELVREGDFHHGSAREATAVLLGLADPPTAVFAANDEQALGVYATAQAHGLRVPEDLSVVGFDDVPMSQWVLPPLTTVQQPIRELAALATRSLLGLGEGDGLPARGRVELPTTLVVRASTAPPPERPPGVPAS